LKHKKKSEEWKADPEITMTINNPFTWKDWLLVSGVVVFAFVLTLAAHFILGY